jgi:hypothetical protein
LRADVLDREDRRTIADQLVCEGVQLR